MVDNLGHQINSIIKGLLWTIAVSIIVIIALGTLLALVLAGVM